MKIPRQEYTLEFKELAVKRIKDGQPIASVAKELGISAQTLRNWIGAAARGALAGSAAPSSGSTVAPLPKLNDRRAAGVGARFRAPSPPKERP